MCFNATNATSGVKLSDQLNGGGKEKVLVQRAAR